MNVWQIDVKNKPLGRMASEIAVILQGKKHPAYEPKFSGADQVIIKNIKDLKISGNKFSSKIYYKHTGPLGHLKARKYREVFLKSPAWILKHAVRLMLPKNRLQKERLKRLIIE